MVRIDHEDALNSYVLKISFKRWAKLWAPASLAMHPLEMADQAEQRDLQIASYIQAIPWNPIQRAITRKRYSLKKRSSVRDSGSGELPNCFLIECYNPNPETVAMTLSIRSDSNPLAFQKLFLFRPGFNREHVALSEIQRLVDLSRQFQVDLTPNEIADGLALYFGAMDFVVDSAFEAGASVKTPEANAPKPGMCKCVVWDLDNTLWHGILIEDGAANIHLKPGIREILKTLDERGILVSVVSKNDHDDAWSVLRQFEIDEYFLFPRISWNPKSQGVQQIAKDLNIGIDSLLFIDDSPFEIAEVKTVCPDITVLDATRYQEILNRPDCQALVTDEGRKRRHLYREQAIRQQAQGEFRGDYLAFLRECELRVGVASLNQVNLERVHELTQRTNQMNFSGNRYSRHQLERFIDSTTVATYVIDCIDKFGNYGTVGFCIVNLSDIRMIDLMFSCRIQGKRVEHGFIAHLIQKYREDGANLSVDYRKTKKNAGPGRVFEDLGFEITGEVGGVIRLLYPPSRLAPEEGIVSIENRSGKRLGNLVQRVAAPK
jgi:FkbH-like protein